LPASVSTFPPLDRYKTSTANLAEALLILCEACDVDLLDPTDLSETEADNEDIAPNNDDMASKLANN
jgi:hypothetical protein